MKGRTLYDVAIDIMRTERGLIAWGLINDVSFEGPAFGSDPDVVLGLNFTHVLGDWGPRPQDRAALLDQAAQQMIEATREHRRIHNERTGE